MYRFLAGFPLIKRLTLFFLINKNGKSFASFKKKKNNPDEVKNKEAVKFFF
jgi:hypothetical protein